MDEPIRETSPGAAKRLELSILFISPRNAGIASFRLHLKERRPHDNQPTSRRLSKIPPNQQYTSEPARFQRISQTHRIGSTPGIRQIPAHGFSRTSHRPPQSATARGSQPGRGLIVKRLFGLIRVRGVPIVRAQSPFYTDSSLDVLCPLVGFF